MPVHHHRRAVADEAHVHAGEVHLWMGGLGLGMEGEEEGEGEDADRGGARGW